MISTRLPVLFAFVSLWIGIVAGTAARADPQPIVSYGNLGTSGTGNLSATSTTTGTSQTTTQRLAAGFTTGTSIQSLSLLSITLGIAAPVNQSGLRSVGIYDSVGGNPGSLLYTSSSVFVSDKNKYSFAFGWSQLDANKSYWLVPSDPLLWYTSEFDDPPAGLNSSGYSYLGTKRYGTGGSGTTWYTAGTTSYALSIVAIPEPSSLPMCFGGLGTAAVFAAVRRLRRQYSI